MKILLIEDDVQVCAFIKKGLSDAGHAIDIENNGKSGLHLARTEHYDVIILDRMLPEMDGIEIIKALKRDGYQAPVIILSALGDIDDRVIGLKSGSDDYLVKPFAFVELLARIEVLGRRRDISEPPKIKVQDLELDLISRSVSRAGKNIDLQAREFKLLEYMLRHKNQIITRAMLLENVWDYHFDPQTNVIDVHISRLRNKIDKDFESPIIRTVRGSGYIIQDE
jgi:two-component system OmpR family response regulator